MFQKFEISEIYTIGQNEYIDKIVCEIDEDGIIINPPLVHILKENEEAKLLGQEKDTLTILKPSAIALAKKILEFYEVE